MHNVFIIPVAVARTPHAPSSSFLSSKTMQWQQNSCVGGGGCGGMVSVTQMDDLTCEGHSVGVLTPLSRARAQPHFPLGVESLGDCGDHHVLEGRGPGSGHAHELALTKPLWVWEHGGHSHVTLSSSSLATPALR